MFELPLNLSDCGLLACIMQLFLCIFHHLFEIVAFLLLRFLSSHYQWRQLRQSGPMMNAHFYCAKVRDQTLAKASRYGIVMFDRSCRFPSYDSWEKSDDSGMGRRDYDMIFFIVV